MKSSFKRESRCDEIKLAAPEAKVLMGVKVEVLIVLEATRSMEGGNANVVGIELRATWSMQGGDANVIGVQIQGGHGLRRAVGQELCHGGRAITFSTSTTRATKSTQIVAATR